VKALPQAGGYVAYGTPLPLTGDLKPTDKQTRNHIKLGTIVFGSVPDGIVAVAAGSTKIDKFKGSRNFYYSKMFYRTPNSAIRKVLEERVER